MAQKNRTNMLSDIVTNIYTNIINYITGNNAQQRLINLLDSSPNILSDKDQANGYVGTNASNEMSSAYYSETITYANIVIKQGAATLVPRKFYVITNAVSGTKFLRVQAATDSTLFAQANDLTAGTTGTYVLGTDTYTPATGSSSAPIPITNAALLTAIGASGLTADALYRVTDAPNYPAVVRALTTNTITSEAEIEGFGWGNYDATSNTWVGLRYDALGNVYNGVLPSEVTLGGAGCKRNIFNRLDTGAFIFNDDLINLTVEAGCTGEDYTASPDYDFMYNLPNSSRIFRDGSANFHEYWDGTQYVITNLTTLAVINIGGGGSVAWGSITGTLSSQTDLQAALDAKLDIAAGANYRLTASDSSGNRGNAAAITASRALKSDANGIPTHFDTATEPTLTELSYVKGVTSAIQQQLNANAPIVSVGDGTAVTGTTANTYSKGILIPANSRGANQAPQIDCGVSKTGTAGTLTLRFYWNTSNDLTGTPILLGTTAAGAASTLSFSASRVLEIEVAAGTGNGTKVMSATTALSTSWGAIAAAMTVCAIDWTSNGYLIVAVQNSSAADSSVCNMIKLH